MRHLILALSGLALAVAFGGQTACSSSSSETTPDGGGGSGGGGQDSSLGDVTFDGPAPTWNNFAKSFCATYCVECHSATVPCSGSACPSSEANQNFNLYADVVDHKALIRCGVSPVGDVQSGCPTLASGGFPPPGQFPIYNAEMSNPKPNDAERLEMIAWINAGAHEN
jgi:hypothetical protein